MLKYNYTIKINFKKMNSKELFYKILNFASDNKYPDIHLTTGNLPIMRNHSGELFKLENFNDNPDEKNKILTKNNIKDFIIEII
jgi:Tfp pilus assembly pilus retraction ATPase PilT